MNDFENENAFDNTIPPDRSTITLQHQSHSELLLLESGCQLQTAPGLIVVWSQKAIVGPPGGGNVARCLHPTIKE